MCVMCSLSLASGGGGFPGLDLAFRDPAWDLPPVQSSDIRIVPWTDDRVASAAPNGESGSDHGLAYLGTNKQDRIVGSQNADLIEGRANNDAIAGGGGADLIRGGRGSDELDGGRGRDELRGGMGQDVLFGGAGRDNLRGGKGDDFLLGGPGRDHYWGGAGRDTFVIGSDGARDRIHDFTAGVDRIDLTEFGITDLDDLLDQTSQRKTHLIMELGGADSLRLDRVSADDLSADDFIF